MKNKRERLLKSESGLTLAEVLVSIVLISIVMLLFIMIFTQFFNTSRKSEEVISATYVAQTEMEYLYELSRTVPVTEVQNKLMENEYVNIGFKDGWLIFEKNDEYKIHVKLKLINEEDELEPVVVEVYDFSTSQLEAKMENLLEWEG